MVSQVVIPEGDGGLPSEPVARTEHVRVRQSHG
jgi:hypothetical protein